MPTLTTTSIPVSDLVCVGCAEHLQQHISALAGVESAHVSLSGQRLDLTTVASEQSLSARMLSIRNDAFAKLGDKNLADKKIAGSSPSWKVTEVTDYTEAQDPDRMRLIKGTFTVPC